MTPTETVERKTLSDATSPSANRHSSPPIGDDLVGLGDLFVGRCYICNRPLVRDAKKSLPLVRELEPRTGVQIAAARFVVREIWRYACRSCEPTFNRDVVIPHTDGRVRFRPSSRTRFNRPIFRVPDRHVLEQAERWADDATHPENWN